MPRTTTLPKELIVARYNAGETVQTLADDYARSFATMRENLHRWGADMRRRGPERTYQLKEDFFDTIDTEAKAYWLGFSFADGCVQKTTIRGNWTFRTELMRSDEGHLYKLRDALGTDAPIVQIDDKQSSYVLVCSAQLCRSLVFQGCVPNKTYVGLKTPSLPAKLYRHFYRGLTDGDGGIRSYAKGLIIFDTMGCPELIDDYQDWLVANAGVDKVKLIQRGIVTTVQYTGGIQVERIARLLYEGAGVFLDRKYAAYQDVLRRPGAPLRVAG